MKLNQKLIENDQEEVIEKFDSDEEENIWFNHNQIKDLSKGVQSKLIIISMICFVFIVVEIIGAKISNSTAILTDAYHLFSDLFGFIFSLISVKLATKKATTVYSYGYIRSEIVGTILSVVIIWFMCLLIGQEAYIKFMKLYHHEKLEIKAKEMFIVSCIGICANLLMVFFLHDHGGHSPGHSCQGHHSHGHVHLKKNKHGNEHDDTHDHSHDSKCNHKHDHEHSDVKDEKSENHIHKQVSSNLSMIEIKDNTNVKAAYAHIIGDLV